MSEQQSQEYRGNGNHEWEPVCESELQYAQRLRVPGGWLYNVVTNTGSLEDGDVNHINTVFVPMPEVVKHKV